MLGEPIEPAGRCDGSPGRVLTHAVPHHQLGHPLDIAGQLHVMDCLVDEAFCLAPLRGATGERGYELRRRAL